MTQDYIAIRIVMRKSNDDIRRHIMKNYFLALAALVVIGIAPASYSFDQIGVDLTEEILAEVKAELDSTLEL